MKTPKKFGSGAPKKMAKGGKTESRGSVSASKGSNTSRQATSASPRGGGGGGLFSGIGSAIRGALSGGAGRSPTVTDPKTGQSYARPSYGGMSLKGLTSTDPANVARNRAAAANYAQMQRRDAMLARGDGRANPQNSLAGTVTPDVQAGQPAVPPVTGRVYTPPSAGYRPGIDPEWQSYQVRPTVVMKKGGAVKKSTVKPKGKKK